MNHIIEKVRIDVKVNDLENGIKGVNDLINDGNIMGENVHPKRNLLINFRINQVNIKDHKNLVELFLKEENYHIFVVENCKKV